MANFSAKCVIIGKKKRVSSIIYRTAKLGVDTQTTNPTHWSEYVLKSKPISRLNSQPLMGNVIAHISATKSNDIPRRLCYVDISTSTNSPINKPIIRYFSTVHKLNISENV